MVHILTTTPLKINMETKYHQIKTQKHLPSRIHLHLGVHTPNKLKSWSSTQNPSNIRIFGIDTVGFSPLVFFSVSGHLKISSSEVKLPVASMICEASPSEQLFVRIFFMVLSYHPFFPSNKNKHINYNINNNNQQGKQTTRISWYTFPRDPLINSSAAIQTPRFCCSPPIRLEPPEDTATFQGLPVWKLRMRRKRCFFFWKKGVQMKDSRDVFVWANIETSIDFCIFLSQRNFRILNGFVVGRRLMCFTSNRYSICRIHILA